MFDKVEAGGLVRRRHFDDLGPVAAQEQVAVQLRQVAGGQDNHVAGLHQFPLPGPAQQGDQGRPVRLAHGPQVHRRHNGFGVFQDQGQGLGQAGRPARGGHDPLRQLQNFPGALGEGFFLGLLAQGPQGPGPDPGDVLFVFFSRRQPLGGWLKGLPEGVFPGGVPELKPQAEIVEDHLAGLGQPLTQKMPERQVIAIHPGIIEDLTVEDKQGRFALVEVLRQFLGPFGELLPGAHR